MRIGFVAWNPFQVFHMRSIAEQIDGAFFVILSRQKHGRLERQFGGNLARFVGMDYLVMSPHSIPRLDGRAEALVCPNPIPHMEELQKTRKIGVQYSMTKERYQYGSWRARFDANLAYGAYSAARLGRFAPAFPVGNPRFHRWFNGKGQGRRLDVEIDPNRPTVLYLPTWGEFSSVDEFLESVAELQGDFNLLTKLHHKSHSHEANRGRRVKKAGLEKRFRAADDLLDLLSYADVVLSDFSGAIFDAIYTSKPVILLQGSPESLVGAKFGPESIEYARRREIGPVVEQPGNLSKVVEAVLSGELDYGAWNSLLRRDCFAEDRNAALRSSEAIEEVLLNSSRRLVYQDYIRFDLEASDSRPKTRSQSSEPPESSSPGIARGSPRWWDRVLAKAVQVVGMLLGWRQPEIERRLCGLVVGMNPLNAAAIERFAELNLQADRLAAALEYFDQAETVSPSRPRVWEGRARTLEAMGRPHDALVAWRKAAALSPASAHLSFELGRSLDARGRTQEALAALERAHHLGAHSAHQLYVLARAHRKLASADLQSAGQDGNR